MSAYFCYTYIHTYRGVRAKEKERDSLRKDKRKEGMEGGSIGISNKITWKKIMTRNNKCLGIRLQENSQKKQMEKESEEKRLNARIKDRKKRLREEK